MKIDKDKHLKLIINELNSALDYIERLRVGYTENKAFHAILEKAIEWYETDNINAYIFFHKVFSVSNKDPIEFYDGLASFLVNTLLDDSCFELEWVKYNIKTGHSDLPANEWSEDFSVSVNVLWSHDDSPNRSVNAGLMLKAMEYLEDKDRRREEFDKTLDNIK